MSIDDQELPVPEGEETVEDHPDFEDEPVEADNPILHQLEEDEPPEEDLGDQESVLKEDDGEGDDDEFIGEDES